MFIKSPGVATYHNKCTFQYESPISNGSEVMTNVKVFRYVGHRSQSRSLGQIFCMNGKASSEGMYT